MKQVHDTIAAIATAPGAAGIAIVRVSGPEALALADRLFRCSPPAPSARPAGTFVYGHLHTGHDLDEVILLIYRAPASYTREDVVEFQGHGGSASAQRLLRAVLSAGARLAAPGEFTRRAFLSGRIDLLQAEAVMDLIQARSERAAAAALEQLDGSLSSKFNHLYDRLIGLAADLEARLDFEEGDLPASSIVTLRQQLDAERETLRQLADSWNEGHLLRDGALVVIAGKPNAGKSTLMNALLGKARAIVTDIPGTTRDTLEEQLILNGFPIRIVDTAGIRDADCGIEQEGIRRARHLVKTADLTLLMTDGSKPLEKADHALIGAAIPDKTLVIINKIDQGQHLHQENFKNLRAIPCAIQSGLGLDQVKTELVGRLQLAPASAPAHAAISERHLALIRQSEPHLERASALLQREDEAFEMMAASEIRDTLDLLGEATGRKYHTELLNTIFARFCVGK